MRVATKPGFNDFYVFREVNLLGQPVGQNVQLAVRGDQVVVISTGLTAYGRVICGEPWRPRTRIYTRNHKRTRAAKVRRQIRVFSIAVRS